MVALYVLAWDVCLPPPPHTHISQIDLGPINGQFGDASFVAAGADLWNDLIAIFAACHSG